MAEVAGDDNCYSAGACLDGKTDPGNSFNQVAGVGLIIFWASLVLQAADWNPIVSAGVHL